MIYYTSDLHLGHESVIKLCNRPFSSIEEMDESLIKAWNGRVHRNDHVYILGDLIFKAAQSPEYYLERLRGRKHLIIGNHDRTWLDKVELGAYFESVEGLDVINTGDGKATLCHYPLMAYERKYLIHGHMHGRKNTSVWDVLKADEFALNAGVDVNGYMPVTLEELIENNRRHKAEGGTQ